LVSLGQGKIELAAEHVVLLEYIGNWYWLYESGQEVTGLAKVIGYMRYIWT
jgi:glucan-binding YG repeat protein